MESSHYTKESVRGGDGRDSKRDKRERWERARWLWWRWCPGCGGDEREHERDREGLEVEWEGTNDGGWVSMMIVEMEELEREEKDKE